MYMKLAKALKEKNRLVGEVRRLKDLIQRENSRIATSTSKIDCNKLWIDLDDAINKLVNIKTAIFNANSGIYGKIARMGELKSKADWIKTISTLDGPEELPTFRAEPIKTEHRAFKKQEDIDNMTVAIQNEIAKLQDELDEYNATVNVAV